jgi:RND family efflux transporter MFP subunit
MRRASIVACLVLAACGRAADDGDVRPTASIRSQVLVGGLAEETLIAYGAAEFAPQAERVLTAPIEARVTRVLRPTGSRVAPGDAVAVLEATPASRLELAKSRAEAAAADAAEARARRLRADGLDSDADVETARSAAQIADAALRLTASGSDGPLILRSPIAGVVESVAFDVGAVAAMGAAVTKVGALEGVRARLGVEPSETRRLYPGLVVRLSRLTGGAGGIGKITQVDPRLDLQTRQLAVAVSYTGGGFAPGEPLKGEIVIGRRSVGVFAPRAAVVYDGDQPFVFVVDTGHARKQPVSLGLTAGDAIEVTRGLRAGQRIAVDGAAALEDGMAVRESPAAADSGP